MSLERELKYLLGLAAACAVFLIFLASGCAPALNPQTKATIDQNHQKTAIAVDAIHQKAKVAAANAKENPLRHPFAATNQTVKEARRPLSAIVLLSFVILGASLGVAFTPLSMISKFAIPISGGVFILSFTGLIVLPFSPIIVCALVAGSLALVVYEIIRYRKQIEAEIAAKLAAGGITLLEPQPKSKT